MSGARGAAPRTLWTTSTMSFARPRRPAIFMRGLPIASCSDRTVARRWRLRRPAVFGLWWVAAGAIAQLAAASDQTVGEDDAAAETTDVDDKETAARQPSSTDADPSTDVDPSPDADPSPALFKSAGLPPEFRGPDVTLIAGEERMVYEYRQNGQLRMIKIVPKRGKPYYLVPRDRTRGGGDLEQARMLMAEWVLWEF